MTRIQQQAKLQEIAEKKISKGKISPKHSIYSQN
jgi:hypothetical protein